MKKLHFATLVLLLLVSVVAFIYIYISRFEDKAADNEQIRIQTLRDSIIALQQSIEQKSAKDHEEPASGNDGLAGESKFVFCEIEYSYYTYEYIPGRVHQSPQRILYIDQHGEHYAPPEETIIEAHWGKKELITKTAFCEVTEIKDYNEDAKYKFLDKIESRLRATSNLVSQDKYYKSPKPSSEFKVLSRKFHEFDSYAEASKVLQLLR